MTLSSNPPHDLIRRLQQGRRFLITSHQRPDGDAIGSAFAMALALQSLGRHATVVMDAVPPAYLAAFPHVGELMVTTDVRESVDAVLVMECSSLSRCGACGSTTMKPEAGAPPRRSPPRMARAMLPPPMKAMVGRVGVG